MAKAAIANAVALLLLLAVATARAQEGGDPVPVIGGEKKPSVLGVLSENELQGFATLATAASASDLYDSPDATVTVIAPTDKAIEEFLAAFGYSSDDIINAEAFADAVAAYHTVLGVALSEKDLFAQGDKVNVPTVDGFVITFEKTDKGITATDAQGNKANVVKAALGNDKQKVWVVDKVLFSGTYFKSLGDLLNKASGQFSTAAAAAGKSGQAKALASPSFSDTLFLPTNAAFEKAGVKLGDAAALAALLDYHTVPEQKVIPGGFDSGRTIKTKLEGGEVILTMISGKELDKTSYNFRAVVWDSKSRAGNVVRPNVFVGKGVVHVIDNVLTPPASAVQARAGAAAAASVAPAPTASKPKEVPLFVPFTISFGAGKGSSSGSGSGSGGAKEAGAADAAAKPSTPTLEVPKSSDLSDSEKEIRKALLSNGAFVETKITDKKTGKDKAKTVQAVVAPNSDYNKELRGALKEKKN